MVIRLFPSQQSNRPTYRKVQTGSSNTCLYLAFPIEGEARGGFYICLYLAGFASVVFFHLPQGKAWVI